MNWIITLVSVAIILVISAPGQTFGRKYYTGYQVLEVVPSNEEQVSFLKKLQLSDDDLYFESRPMRGSTVQIMAPPESLSGLTKHLRKAGLNPSVKIADMQSVLEPLYERLDKRMRAGSLAFDINDFNTFPDISSWLITMVSSCRSGLKCELSSLGKTHENKDIHIFRISKEGSGRKAVFIDGTINSMNWLSTSTALNILNALALGSNPEAVRLADEFDWHIVPVVNPDGYNYTMGYDRRWLKNRRPNGACFGINLNLNYASYWGAEGVSNSPCNNEFCGTSAGSEAEVRSLQAELRRLAPTLRATFSINSFGALWTFSYGYTVNHEGVQCVYTTDYNNMLNLANIAADASEQVAGTKFSRGSVCDLMDGVSGISLDFIKDSAGVHNAFGVNVRGDSFSSDKTEIVPTYNEIWSGIVALLDALP